MQVTEQTTLTREQKQAVGLLSIGTFLEYFELMLFIHMAVFVNELFFPKTDPVTEGLVTAAAFCATYFMRPVGALIFGYIGDNIGRKQTVVITTLLAAMSSFTMFVLPPYAQIGIAASWIVIIARMIQGMASMGESMGAQLYLTELLKPPKQYYIVSSIRVISVLGTVCALLVALMSIKYALNWRYAFLFCTIVALVGYVARASLRETPEFLLAKKRFLTESSKKKILSYAATPSKRVAISYFFIESTYPIWIYVGYIYYGSLLKSDFSYKPVDVIQHNLYLAILSLIIGITVLALSRKIYPLFLMYAKAVIFCLGLPFCMWFVNNENSVFYIIVLQVFMKIFNPSIVPGDAIFFSYFPILKRFTSASLIYSFSRVIMYIITSFGAVYLTKYFGTYGLLIIIIPIMSGYFYGLNTFINLEREAGNHPEKNAWNKFCLNMHKTQA